MVYYSGSTFFLTSSNKSLLFCCVLRKLSGNLTKVDFNIRKIVRVNARKTRTCVVFFRDFIELLLCCFNLRFKRFLSFSFHLSMLANNKQFTVFLNRSFFPLFNCICLPTINYDPYRSPQCSYCASTNRPNITCPWVEFAFSQTFPKFEFPARMQISNFWKSL